MTSFETPFFQNVLTYKGSRVHRIVKDFIVQLGDITVGDGSGGKINNVYPGPEGICSIFQGDHSGVEEISFP